MLPIKIDLSFSQWLAGYLLTIHLAALLLILLLQPPLLFSTILILLTCLSLGYYWRRDLGGRATSYLEWSEGKGWRIRQTNGDLQQATLTPESYLNRHLVALQFITDENRAPRLLLPADAMQPDLHRRLRVLLRLENHFGE